VRNSQQDSQCDRARKTRRPPESFTGSPFFVAETLTATHSTRPLEAAQGGATLELAIEETMAPVLGPEKRHKGADSPWKLLQLLSHQPPQGDWDRFKFVLDE